MVFKSAKWKKEEQNENQDFHCHDPFFKSYPEIGSTWLRTKCRGRKSFDTWCYIVTCARLCVSVSSKSKAINVFPKHSEIKSTWPIKSSKEEINLSCDSKELFEQHFLKVFDQIRSKWRCEIKEQVAQLALLYHGRDCQKQPLEVFNKKPIPIRNIHREHCVGVYF